MNAPAAEHPYASFVHLVQKPARYLGGEFGISKKDWAKVDARVCLAFPDIYDIGMSHLGFKILYKILNDDPRTLAERCYAPWIDMQGELVRRKLPLVSLESARPLSDFDVVGFSLQFELTYSNILMMLDLGGVPLLAADRGNEDPLVIAGGPTATHPEPLVDFLDAVVIGDGEERATEVALLWTSLKANGVPRKERLRELAKLHGVYVPSLYATKVDPETGFTVVDPEKSAGLPFPIARSLVEDLNKFPFPSEGPVGGPEAIFDRMSIEIARGCTEGCRFCQAGMIYRPVRERDPAQIVETIVQAVKTSGYDEASLTSLSTADYSCIAPLIKTVTERLAPEKVSLGVSSLRAYGLEEDVLDDIQRVRAAGITFAPEAGSQRMRDVVNKNVTEEQLMTTAERIFSRGWVSMKLYFMIGLPTEEEEDVREIVRVGIRAREVGRVKKREQKQGPPKVTVSVSTHVPKPHTPFQWCAMDTAEIVYKKQAWLKEEVRGSGVDLRMHDCEGSWLEGVFARGDRTLGKVLLRAYRMGVKFDSWEDKLRIDWWETAFREEGIDPAIYLGTIPVSARLPWDHIDVGLEEGFLAREYRKALKSRLSLPCGKAAGMFIHHTNLADAEKDQRKLVCYDCGVACDLGAMREERLVYLSKLGAKERRERKVLDLVPVTEVVSEPAPTVPSPASPPVKKKGKRPPPMIVQGAARRYRFHYTKTGPSASLSHLDLIRALPRAFRRINVPMFYSSGYHPKPEMVFGPALSLGVASLAETVDVKLACEVDAREVARMLTAASQDGITFVDGIKLESKDSGVSKLIRAAEYVVGIPDLVLDQKGGKAWLADRITWMMQESSLRVLRKIEGIGKWVEIKDFLRAIRLGEEYGSRILHEAGMVGRLTSIVIDVDILGSGAVKVSEVVAALLGSEDEIPYRAVRSRMGMRDTDHTIVPPIEWMQREATALAAEAPIETVSASL